MATWTGNGPNSKTFVYNIKTGERSWQVDLNTQNHSEIKEMQQKLTNFCYSTQGADGTYGNNTKTAVINFQRAFPACGTPDGYFGKNTLNTFVSKVGSLAGYTGSGSGGSGGTTDDINVGDTVITILPGVNFRLNASSTSSRHFQVSTGTTMVVTDITNNEGYTWYKGVISSKTGYLRGDCIEKYTGGSSGGGTGSGSSDDFTDNVTTNPTVTTHYTFYAANAVAYAKAHSSNVNTDASDNKVPDPKRNTSFREGATGACANFVHQCLLAGGARMFDGWCYKLTGVPSSWDSASWTYTNKGRRRLLEKKWIERIPSTSVKAGDIIYSYYSDYASRDMNTPFNHVTIAITDYDSSTQGCNVCGHTLNQNNKFKKLSDTGIPCTYCYRVKTSLGGDGTEKAIDLTNGNSHAI